MTIFNQRMSLPWGKDSRKWEPGIWYPGPCSQDIEFNGREITVAAGSWDLFRLDPRYKPGDNNFGDIDCMGLDVPFLEAVKIANNVNGKKLWTASWIDEDWAKKT